MKRRNKDGKFPVSPFRGGILPPKPRDVEHARAIIDGQTQTLSRISETIDGLVADMREDYASSCRAYLEHEYARLEDTKKAFAEHYAKLLEKFDDWAFVAETIAIAKRYCDERGADYGEKPLIPPVAVAPKKPKQLHFNSYGEVIDDEPRQ